MSSAPFFRSVSGYCNDSYQVFYCARIIALEAFTETDEAYGPGLFSPNEAKERRWARHNGPFYEASLQRVQSSP